MMHHSKTILFVFAACLIGLATTGMAERDGEYLLKSGYLYHFAQFIEWPPEAFSSSDTPFVIAVYGQNPFAGTLRTLEQRRVHGRPVQIIVLPDNPDAIPDVHILFLPESHMHRFADVRRAIADRPVALIGESPGFAAQGGLVNFYVERERVGFEINTVAAKAHQLVVSSRLLRLARLVEPVENPPSLRGPDAQPDHRTHVARAGQTHLESFYSSLFNHGAAQAPALQFKMTHVGLPLAARRMENGPKKRTFDAFALVARAVRRDTGTPL